MRKRSDEDGKVVKIQKQNETKQEKNSKMLQRFPLSIPIAVTWPTRAVEEQREMNQTTAGKIGYCCRTGHLPPCGRRQPVRLPCCHLIKADRMTIQISISAFA